MFTKSLMLNRYGLASSIFAAMKAHDDDEGVGIIELDTNLSDIEKPMELPAGLYVGEVQDVQIGISQKGNSYYQIKFVIPNDQIAADVADQFEDGAALYYNRIVVPTGKDRRALFNLRKFIEALGLDSNVTQIDPNEWMGQQARLKIVHEKWQGESRAQIKAVESAEAAAPKKETASKGRGRK